MKSVDPHDILKLTRWKRKKKREKKDKKERKSVIMMRGTRGCSVRHEMELQRNEGGGEKKVKTCGGMRCKTSSQPGANATSSSFLEESHSSIPFLARM